VKAQVTRTTHYAVLGIALILAVATLSIVSPSRAATSAAFNVTTRASSSDWTTYMQGYDRIGFANGESRFNPTSVKESALGVAGG
jgi:hypothetical protein